MIGGTANGKKRKSVNSNKTRRAVTFKAGNTVTTQRAVTLIAKHHQIPNCKEKDIGGGADKRNARFLLSLLHYIGRIFSTGFCIINSKRKYSKLSRFMTMKTLINLMEIIYKR